MPRLFKIFVVASASLLAAGGASAAPFLFNSDPFAGSTALTTPGRQIVGGEPSITFNVATDQFVFDRTFFNVGPAVNFGNGPAASLPTSGLNVVVLSADTAAPFNAGLAADLLASRITADGAGFFVYFNTGLDLPRLVYSTNLNDNTSDLRVLARLTNLSGNPASLGSFTAANFAVTPVPEPGGWAMLLLGFGLIGTAARHQRRAVLPVGARSAVALQ